MEAEATVHTTSNGVEKNAPAPELAEPRENSIALTKLLDRREKMVQGLNSVKAEREAVVQRLKDLDISVARTEGAVITINGLIGEIDPQAAQQMGG